MTEKITALPVLRGEARIMFEEEDRPDDSFHNVYCTVCGAQFWVKSKTEAIAAWNRRADACGARGSGCKKHHIISLDNMTLTGIQQMVMRGEHKLPQLRT